MFDDVISEYRQKLPPAFAGVSLDQLTGDALRWRTIQNLKCRGEIPTECFVRQGGKKLLIVRDPFLDWWASQLEEA